MRNICVYNTCMLSFSWNILYKGNLMNSSALPLTRQGVFTKIRTTCLAFPWCCFISGILALTTTTGSMIGLFFDELLHFALPFLVLIHCFSIWRYWKKGCRSIGQTRFLIFTTLLFVVSIGFHFTDFHDELFEHAHEARHTHK